MRKRGWKEVDIILVTGDAFVDHPSFGAALIGRWLEAHGYRVAILAQPRYDSPDAFRIFGPPRLFWGITSGNLDSIVANYTGNARVRKNDAYSPDGNPYFDGRKGKKTRRRPDRAVIVYANLARQAFRDVPVVIGGIEASLRRFIHYDFQQEKLRGSILTDSKADILVYGMGERAVVAIAERLKKGKGLENIPGTCIRVPDRDIARIADRQDVTRLPSWDDILKNRGLFLDAELETDAVARAGGKQTLIQRQQAMWVVQNPAQPPLSTEEMDRLYGLPFTRRPHPDSADIPAFKMIEHSITALRGCFGNCSFCAIARHQGPVITSRSRDSIIREAKHIATQAGFRGVISDIGGPTANMYGASCKLRDKCRKHDCLFPTICRNLDLNANALEKVLEEVRNLPGIRHLFISSGLRMDMLLETPSLLETIITRYQAGAIKVAPEHTSGHVLELMHKPDNRTFRQFVKHAAKIASIQKKKVRFTPYIISAHPGCTVNDMKQMAANLRETGITHAQVQDFTPSPGTISTAMYVTGLDRYRKKDIHIPAGRRERRAQREAVQAVLKQR
jgi:uncharacterized radical SAM protein YgiQ